MKIIKKYYILIITIIFFGSSALLALYMPAQTPGIKNDEFKINKSDIPEKIDNYNYEHKKEKHFFINCSPVVDI